MVKDVKEWDKRYIRWKLA